MENNTGLQRTIKTFVIKGKSKEITFASLFQNVSMSSNEENMKEHFDLTVHTKIDVKGLKKLKRSDNETNENFHIIELMNVNGDTGWLYGEGVEYFAFELKEYWIVVEKESLQKFIAEKCKDKISSKFIEPYKLYRRTGRKDIMTQVTSYDLCYLSAGCMIKKSPEDTVQ